MVFGPVQQFDFQCSDGRGRASRAGDSHREFSAREERLDQSRLGEFHQDPFAGTPQSGAIRNPGGAVDPLRRPFRDRFHKERKR